MFKLVVLLLLSCVCVRSDLELFSTFNNIGVTKTTTGTKCDDVEYCQGLRCQPGHPLSLVKRTGNFVGSILWLESGTEYTVRVTCEGESAPEEQTIRTQDELVEHKNPTKTLFVSTNGATDPPVGQECTEADPCDVSVVFDRDTELIIPGTHVLFEDGYYKFGDYYTREGGTKEDPVVFKKKNPDGEVVVDGSATVPNSEFTPVGNLYVADVDVGTNMMRFMALVDKTTGEAKRLLRYHSRTQLENLFYENIGYYAVEDATQISINIGSLDLNDYDVVYTAHSYAFGFTESEYFHLFGFHFRFFGNFYNVRVSSSHVWLKDNIFEHCYRCLALSGKSDHVVIDENEFFDSMFVMSDGEYPSPGWDGVKAAGSMEAGGVTIFTTGEEQLAGRGLVIRNNVWHDWFDSFNCASSSNDLTIVTNEIDVYGNYIYLNSDDGFQIDGDSSNVRVYNNYIENVLSGISVAPSALGPVYIVNNILLNCFGVCYKFNVNDPRETGEVFIYHNVAISHHETISANMNIASHFWQKVTSRNNILYSTHYCWVVTPINDVPNNNVDLDYDACYTNTSYHNLIMKWGIEGGTIERIETLAEVRTLYGQEINGIQITDDEIMMNLFKGRGGRSARFLSDHSVVKGKGVSIPGINNGIRNPDIGLLFAFDRNEAWQALVIGIVSGVGGFLAVVGLIVVIAVIVICVVLRKRNIQRKSLELGETKTKRFDV